jgi:hypothetical protein
MTRWRVERRVERRVETRWRVGDLVRKKRREKEEYKMVPF